MERARIRQPAHRFRFEGDEAVDIDLVDYH